MKLIRKAKIRDAEDIARVQVLSWQHAYHGIIPESFLDGLSIPGRAEFWRSNLAAEPEETLVVEAEREVVGFAGFGATRDKPAAPTSAELYAIYIAPGHWGSGCGSLLWGEVKRNLIAARFSHVTLWVLSKNQRGRRFYEHHGFRVDGISKVISFSGTPLTEVRYGKEI
jgi:ribosomal protein S18 acetylase RimI-like enzyme